MAGRGDEGSAFAAGTLLGFALSALIFGVLITQVVQGDSYDEQFKKDCTKMAHGTVDKSAANICVKNGKILFHQ